MNDISLFDFIDDLEPEDIQMEVVAADLSMLLVHSNCTRSQLAAKLACKKSRITRILSGDENLTLKTLTKVADALDYTFDIVFYNKSYAKPKQPWHIDRERRIVTKTHSEGQKKPFTLELQLGAQVVSDVIAGNESGMYIKISKNDDDSRKQLVNISSGTRAISYDIPAGYTSTLKEKELVQ